MKALLRPLRSLIGASVLFAASAIPVASFAADFTYNSILPVYLKLDKTMMPEDIVDGYMQTYRPEVWSKYKDDEFEMDTKRKESLAMLKDVISSARADETFTIQTRFQFGEYNFEKQQFDFHPFSEGLYFNVTQCCSSLLNSIKVSFANPETIDGIPMEKAAAKQFLSSRKSSGGYVNRDIFARIKIHMTGVKTRGELVAQIDQVQLLDNQGRNVIATLGQQQAASN